MDAPRPRTPSAASRGQHFLSPRSAAELVDRFQIRPDDIVVEIGAGTGRLTRELSRVAGLVLAVELDERLTPRLVHRTARWPAVYLHEGDAMEVAFPRVPFRVVGNLPFGITTSFLRRAFGDPNVQRLDVVIELAAARKRARPGGSVLSVLWHTTWHFSVEARIPRDRFHPRPSVDAAWLLVSRRPQPLLGPWEMRAFERLVRIGFRAAQQSVGVALRVHRSAIRAAGIPLDARPVDLDVDQWLAIHRATRRR